MSSAASARFAQRWARVQNDNARWKCFHSKEEFAKCFGTADEIIVEYVRVEDIKIFESWIVHVNYSLLGMFPLTRVTFGTKLCRKEVEALQVPFAKIQCRDGDPVPARFL